MRDEHVVVAAELESERAYLTRAYEALEQMRERTEALLSIEESAAQEVDSRVVASQLARRLRGYVAGGPLCFGRIDDEDEEIFYIGRVHVSDRSGDPVVLDWRARAAAPFYTATAYEPMGLLRRRRFILEGRELVDFAEEDFSDLDPDKIRGGVPDPLLLELDRSRSGHMRDVVATIQGEQDAAIRGPLESLTVVQGGPGTGKTAVGLHRAAYLLFAHRDELEGGAGALSGGQGMLVVGPSQAFLRYVSEVLPSLGETAVKEATLATLVKWRAVREEPTDVHVLKGGRRMGAVIREAAISALGRPSEDLELTVRRRTIHFRKEDLNALFDRALGDGRSLRAARGAFRMGWLDLATGGSTTSSRFGHDPGERRRRLLEAPDAKAALSRLWPTTSAEKLLKRLLTSSAQIETAAAGILDQTEVDILIREARALTQRSYAWTSADLALLDEAESLIDGGGPTWAYGVVDEAQNLSDMELRMIARRIPSGRMTVLGDIAQAVEPSAQDSWESVVATLAGNVPSSVHELTIGYRTPASILDLANLLLPFAAPTVVPAVAIRMGDAPQARRVSEPEAVPAAVVADSVQLLEEFVSVAVIAQRDQHEAITSALNDAGLAYREVSQQGIGEGLNILDPGSSKGLEFDAVIVVEPADIAGSTPRGHRLLFVALTRAVQQLILVASAPLPDALERGLVKSESLGDSDPHHAIATKGHSI